MENSRLKFRRPFFNVTTKKFSHFHYWGIDYPEKGINTFPSVNNKCYNKEDQQFTGLKDKNGKDIYEGDIIKNYNTSIFTKGNIYIVKWQEGEYKLTNTGYEWLYNKPGFIFDNISQGMSLIFGQSQIEIIGNIFEIS